MRDKSDGAPPWLFSFVDLAFLMVIAMTQLAADAGSEMPDLGEMIVPRIASETTQEMPSEASEAWQLRVHPREGAGEFPFELVLIGAAGEHQPERFDRVAELRERLAELESGKGKRPILAPHEESRSQDLLDAAAVIEEFWPGRRRATIARVFES